MLPMKFRLRQTLLTNFPTLVSNGIGRRPRCRNRVALPSCLLSRDISCSRSMRFVGAALTFMQATSRQDGACPGETKYRADWQCTRAQSDRSTPGLRRPSGSIVERINAIISPCVSVRREPKG